MKYVATCLMILTFHFTALAQYGYEPNEDNPFGEVNPNAPEQITDFAPLIGKSECTSQNRAQDGTWNEPVDMLWTFKYIMNGMAVQDETLKKDGAHSGSIRQFNADSLKWYVHYYSSSTAPPILASWEGEKKDNGNIVLYREQAAPNGTEGFYRITFSEISDARFEWLGEWVNINETFTYPTWKISCTKIN